MSCAFEDENHERYMQRRMPDGFGSSKYERSGKKDQGDRYCKQTWEKADDQKVVESKFNEGGACKEEL